MVDMASQEVAQTKNVKCTTGKVGGSPKSLGRIICGPWMSLQILMAIHLFVKIFKSGPK